MDIRFLVVSFTIVLMSPEHAVAPPWRNVFGSPLFKKNLAVVAVDEAHCIPEWYKLLPFRNLSHTFPDTEFVKYNCHPIFCQG